MNSQKEASLSTILVCMGGAGTLGSVFGMPGTVIGMALGAYFGYWASRRDNAKRR